MQTGFDIGKSGKDEVDGKWQGRYRLHPGLPATHKFSTTGGFMDIALDPKYAENG
jgi:hypothetical protein